jgi:hypothetical protein
MESLEASEPLCKRLWGCFRRAATYAELHILLQAQLSPNPATVAALLGIVTPGRLLAWLAEIAPVGQPRDREVIALENEIVRHACSEG